MTTIDRNVSPPRKSVAGTAYIEGIIVIPAMILVFSLILFVREGYTKAENAAEQTRRAGWSNVMASCTSDSVDAPTRMDDSTQWRFSELAGLLSVVSSASTIVRYQPSAILSGPAVTIGTMHVDHRRFTQSATFGRPAAIGGTARYGHKISLTCDEDPAYLKMPGGPLSSGGLGGLTWNFSIWNQSAWMAARL